MPQLLTMGSKSSGEENCPKKKLEVKMPEALPRLLADTLDKNHAFVFTNNNPKAIPIKAVE